ADPSVALPDRTGTAVAGVCAATHAHRSGILFTEGRSAVSLQGNRGGAGAQPGCADRVRLSKLRDIFSDRVGHGSGLQHREARCGIVAGESAFGADGKAKWMRRESEQ